jgi:hypothetical protein
MRTDRRPSTRDLSTCRTADPMARQPQLGGIRSETAFGMLPKGPLTGVEHVAPMKGFRVGLGHGRIVSPMNMAR